MTWRTRFGALDCVLFIIVTAGLRCSGDGGNQPAVETINGVRYVHNSPLPAEYEPPVSVEFIRRYGGLDSEDENHWLMFPSDAVSDEDGNVYIADPGNARIQKFGKDGEFICSIGRKGEGPGEFFSLSWIGFTGDGRLFNFDSLIGRIQFFTPDGRYIDGIRNEAFRTFRHERVFFPDGSSAGFERRTAYLLKRYSVSGDSTGVIGLKKMSDDEKTANYINDCVLCADADGAVYSGFKHANRIEKYSPDGRLVLSIDRPVPFDLPLFEGKAERVAMNGQLYIRTGVSRPGLIMNGIAVDGAGRIWTAAASRAETAADVTGMLYDVYGKRIAATDETSFETDLFALEAYSSDGERIAVTPVEHYCDLIRIYGDRLFIIDRDRTMAVYEYRIIEI